MNVSSTGIIIKAAEDLLQDKCLTFSFKGKGMCNQAFYSETRRHGKILIKVERQDKETDEQNDLTIEAKAIQFLNGAFPELRVPKILFISASPKMYAYEYIEGEMLIDIWDEMPEEKRLKICKELGEFHAKIACLSEADAKEIGLTVHESPQLNPGINNAFQSVTQDKNLPEIFGAIAVQAREIFEKEANISFRQFIHNDAHNENIIIHEGSVAALIDFGDCEYNDVHIDFSYYARHYPFYFHHIVEAYECHSAVKLSKKKILAFAVLSDLNDLLYHYNKDAEGKQCALKRAEHYQTFLYDNSF